MYAFEVKTSENERTFDVSFSDNNGGFDTGFEDVQIVIRGAERYAGEYTVTPTPNEQTLKTAQKYMDADVTIKEIPFFDVANTSGGRTIYIGKELD